VALGRLAFLDEQGGDISAIVVEMYAAAQKIGRER
jgi:hypothetical protein